MDRHYTHNISCSSSEIQHEKYLNNGNSSSSSDKNNIEKNKSPNEWSKLLLIDRSKRTSNDVINEEEINITVKSFGENKKDNENKGNLKGKKKGKKKKFHYKYLGKNCIMLSNGIIVKNVKLKKEEKPKMKMNQFIIARPKNNKDNNNNLNSMIKKAFIPDIYNNKNETDTGSHLELLLKQKEERAKLGCFQMIYIKRPNRSFITKICKYKNQNSKSFKQIKKLNSNLGIYNKKRLNSAGVSPVRIAARQKSIPKTKLQKNKPIMNDNCDTKLGTLSTTTCKKNTMISNASALLNKSNNYLSNIRLTNNALSNNNNKNKKRPLSSFNVVRNEVNINIRSTKVDNYDINTTYNKSSNLQKTKMVSTILIDSKEYPGEINNMMFNNKDFMNQFKELKNDFELYGNKDNNNLNILKTFEDKKNQAYKKKPEYMMIEDNNNEDRIIRKINTAKFKGNSYHKFYPKELSPLFNYKNRNNFEDEKQNKQLNWCIKCGYKKHFGNEKNCPICLMIKEQNHLKEENLSNKKYYFPLKFKFDKNNYAQKTFRKYENYENNINNLFNPKNEDENFKSHNINYIFSTPNNMNFQKNKNNKDLKRSKSGIIDDYYFLQEYFD